MSLWREFVRVTFFKFRGPSYELVCRLFKWMTKNDNVKRGLTHVSTLRVKPKLCWVSWEYGYAVMRSSYKCLCHKISLLVKRGISFETWLPHSSSVKCVDLLMPHTHPKSHAPADCRSHKYKLNMTLRRSLLRGLGTIFIGLCHIKPNKTRPVSFSVRHSSHSALIKY